jgi:nucleoid-associated protein YgaU
VKPEKLRPGMVLNLPDIKEVKGAGGADDDSPAPTLDAQTEYRVQSGDNMNKIALKLYGKSEMWERIYDLNKAKIGNDPAKLKVGMILKLPAPPTQR